MLIFVRVAETISQIVIIAPEDPIYNVVLAGVLGAHFLGSDHLVVGVADQLIARPNRRLCGAGVAHAGFGALRMDKLLPTM